MRIAQSQGLLPYPSSILGQNVVSLHSLVPWALRGFPQQAVSQFFRITSHRLYVFTSESSNEVSTGRARIPVAYNFSSQPFRHIVFYLMYVLFFLSCYLTDSQCLRVFSERETHCKFEALALFLSQSKWSMTRSVLYTQSAIGKKYLATKRCM